MEKTENIKSNEKRGAVTLAVFAVATIVLWQLPGGGYILYPFTILGTWFHEMGHGLAALLLGGNFLYLELYPNGSGLAAHSGPLFLGNIGKALVAGAGPLGPTITGALFIAASTRQKMTSLILFLLGVMLIVSLVFWVRPVFGFGFAVILLFAVVIMYISLKGNPGLKRFALQFLGIQALISLYLSINYLFSGGGVVGGKGYYSDTMVMQQNLFLPYWFWGGLILALSAYIIIRSLVSAYRR